MGLIFIFSFSLVMTVAPIAMINYIEKIKKNGIRVKGRIELIDIDDSGETITTTYYVKFTTQSKVEICEKCRFITKRYRVGQHCEVSYLIQNPIKFIIVEDDYESGYIVFSLFGLIMLVHSTLLLTHKF